MSGSKKQLADKLYNLGLGETLHDFGTDRTSVLCVPGGWIFTYHFDMATSVFVPFSDEFMPSEMRKAQ